MATPAGYKPTFEQKLLYSWSMDWEKTTLKTQNQKIAFRALNVLMKIPLGIPYLIYKAYKGSPFLERPMTANIPKGKLTCAPIPEKADCKNLPEQENQSSTTVGIPPGDKTPPGPTSQHIVPNIAVQAAPSANPVGSALFDWITNNENEDVIISNMKA